MTDAQKVKNLSALVILLAGLFIGSLFVDFVQLATGKGFSGRAARLYNVLPGEDKTWVAYGDPKVSVDVITDKGCAECDPNEALVWLRRVVPTLEATETESGSDTGQALIKHYKIATLPAFVFSKDVTRTDFYAQASSLFEGEGNGYFFNMTKIGLPVGKYLRLPDIRDDAISVGPKDAKMKVIEFSDFQCPYCKAFHKDLAKILKEYQGKILFVYKHLPLSFHAQAENAALAAECADEQGKFSAYADYLFAKQDDWGKSSGTQKFKDYAWYLKLNGRDFSVCLDSKKYLGKMNADKDEAADFSITGTPGTFVNGTFLSGAVSAAELKQAIDAELAK